MAAAINVNWQSVIMDINRMGLSGAQIAERLSVASSTINGLKNAQWNEPRYSLGVRLLHLHEQLQAAGLMSKGQQALL